MQKLLLAILLFTFTFIFINSIHTQALSMSEYFISSEVGPCLTSGGNPKACDISKPNEALVLSAVESLRTEWMSTSQEVCSKAVISGNFLDGNIIEFTGTNQKIFATVTLRDMDLDDINSLSNLGTKATTQGNLSTSTISIMQDSSPKPLSLVGSSYWTENAGSNSANSRNGVLLEFFDKNNNPTEINGFGAWFGDIETRSNVLPAFMRLYDKDGNNLSENIFIPETENTNLTQCGTTSGSGKGCGNNTTRWIGFSDSQTVSVQKLLIVVGEDDLGSDGSREHLSFTGATIAVLANCPISPTLTVTPSYTITITPSPTSKPTPSPDPTSTPVILNTPKTTTTLLPTETQPTATTQPTTTIQPTNRVKATTKPKVSPVRNTPTPSFTPTTRHYSIPYFTPIASRNPKLPKVCKQPVKYIIQNKLRKEIQQTILSEKYKLIHINLKYWK